MIRVIVVAPYASVRAGLQSMLQNSPGIEVTAEAGGSEELARLMSLDAPDAILLDFAEPDGRASLALAADSRIPVVMLGDDPDGVGIVSSASGGGWGFLLKDSRGEEIAVSLSAAAAGLAVVHRSLAITESGLTSVKPSSKSSESLTRRETEVLQLMASGLPNKIIAARLGISQHTVKFHVAAILSKLGASSRTEAVTLGIRGGKVSL